MREILQELAGELAEIGRLVEGDDVASTLDRFVNRVVLTVPHCDEAVIAVQAADEPEIVAHRHRAADEVAEPARAEFHPQLIALEGPLREALEYGEPRRIADLAGDHRWPHFGAAALNAGYRSCLILPLQSSGKQAAAFGLFSETPKVFSDVSYDLVLLFALHAGVSFDNVQLYNDSTRLIEQLQIALGTRTVIGQAQGLLMQRFGLASAVAFEVLKRSSQSGNVRLRSISADLVEAHERGELDQQLRRIGLNPPAPPGR